MLKIITAAIMFVLIFVNVSMPADISSQAQASADSYYWQGGYPASFVNDANQNTIWYSGYASIEHWISMQWPAKVRVDSVHLIFNASDGGFYVPKAFHLQTWNGSAWQTFVSVTNNGRTNINYDYVFPIPLFTGSIRLYFDMPTQYTPTSDMWTRWASLNEFQVTGQIMNNATTILSQQGSNRGTGYNVSSKIVTIGSGTSRKTAVTWLDHSNINSDQTQAMFNVYDYDNHTWRTPLKLGDGVDNHAGGALVLDKTGRLHCVYGAHDSNYKYRYTPVAGNFNTWSTEESFDGGTYPSVVADKSNTEVLHMATRESSRDPRRLVYYRREYFKGYYQSKYVDGYIWRKKAALVDPGISMGYTQYTNSLTTDKLGRLHLAYAIDFQTESMPAEQSKVVGYMRSDDGGNTWKKADGSILSLPVSQTTGEIIRQGENVFLSIGNVVTDEQNNPWVIVSDAVAETAYLYHHSGSAWSYFDLLQVLRCYFPTALTDSDSVITINESGELFAMFSYYNGYGGWGLGTCDIALLSAKLADIRQNGVNADFFISVIPSDPTVADWLPSIETSTGFNSVVNEPVMLYTRGNWDALQTQIFATMWPKDCRGVDNLQYTSPLDLNKDCSVDFLDLSVIAADWLDCVDPQNANCSRPWPH